MADIVPPVPPVGFLDVDNEPPSFIDRIISETRHESVVLAGKTGLFVALYLLLTVLSRSKSRRISKSVTQITIWSCFMIIVYILRMVTSPSALEVGLPIILMTNMFFAHKDNRDYSELVAIQIVLLILSSFLIGLNTRMEGNPMLVNVGVGGSVVALGLGIASNI